MNKAILSGNLTKDLELRETADGKSVANFTIAVNGYGDSVNYFSIVVWGNQADNCAKYLKKGSKVGIVGRLQNRSYEANDGSKKYITEVVAEEVEFLTPKQSEETTEPKEMTHTKVRQPTLIEMDGDGLPF